MNTKDTKEIQIGATYILDENNPFSDCFAVAVEEKAGYVKYHYTDSDYFESMKTDEFLKIYQLYESKNNEVIKL